MKFHKYQFFTIFSFHIFNRMIAIHIYRPDKQPQVWP